MTIIRRGRTKDNENNEEKGRNNERVSKGSR